MQTAFDWYWTAHYFLNIDYNFRRLSLNQTVMATWIILFSLFVCWKYTCPQVWFKKISPPWSLFWSLILGLSSPSSTFPQCVACDSTCVILTGCVGHAYHLLVHLWVQQGRNSLPHLLCLLPSVALVTDLEVVWKWDSSFWSGETQSVRPRLFSLKYRKLICIKYLKIISNDFEERYN